MLATVLQFGFLLLVAIGNLCLGFVMARRLGWGRSLPIALYALRSRWRVGSNGMLPLDPAESPTERQSSDESDAAEPLAAPGDATPHDAFREAAEAMATVAQENGRLLDEIAAGLQQAGEAVTISELEAAVSQINDVGQRLQQRLNSAADLFRQDGEAKDDETAERLERLWQSINDALLGLMLLSLDPEALAEPVRQVIEAIQIISQGGQEAADKLAVVRGGAGELVGA
jgi:hypothetical protein